MAADRAHAACPVLGFRPSTWLREAEASAAPDPAQLTICLADADALSPAAQQTVRAWVELGLPPGIGMFPRVRWIATVADDLTMGAGMARALTPDLTPDLAQALAGLSVRIPPLRERPEAIEALTRDTVLAWSTARGTPQRVFAPQVDSRQRTLLHDHRAPGEH